MNTLHICNGDTYLTTIIDTIHKVYDSAQMPKIGFLSFNRTYEAISEMMHREYLLLQRFVIIDGITRSIDRHPPKRKNCVYLQRPKASESLAKEIMKILKRENAQYLLLDSITTLLFYSKPDEVRKFLQHLTSFLSHNKIDSTCFLLGRDEGVALREWQMFFDSTIRSESQVDSSLIHAESLISTGMASLAVGDQDSALHSYLRLKLLYKDLSPSGKAQLYKQCLNFRDLLQDDLVLSIPTIMSKEE